MRTNLSIKLTTAFLCTALTPIVGFAKTEQFQMKSFVTAASAEPEVVLGLQKLYKDKINPTSLAARTVESIEFQNLVRQTLDTAIATNSKLNVEVTERTLTGNFVKETTVKFPSLIQRPGNHAANTMIARIYEPAVQDKSCEYKYPTTIMLHHILNEVEKIEDVGKVISSGILNQPSIVVVIQMPHYGQRRNGNEEFLNSDFASFRKNMLQLILDVHLLKNYVETRPNVDTKHFSLSGFSLGAVMGLTVGAFDQSFNSYAFLMGGTDMAHILMNRVRTQPDSEVSKALDKTIKDESLIRDQIASVDSMTWLHRYKSKNLFFLNNNHDQIVDYDTSVAPTISNLKLNNNKISARVNEGEHVPSGSALDKLKKIFRPFTAFLAQDTEQPLAACKEQNPYSN